MKKVILSGALWVLLFGNVGAPLLAVAEEGQSSVEASQEVVSSVEESLETEETETIESTITEETTTSSSMEVESTTSSEEMESSTSSTKELTETETTESTTDITSEEETALEKAKKNGKSIVSGLVDDTTFTSADAANFNAQIEAAESTAGINLIIQEANNLKELNTIKNEVKESLQELLAEELITPAEYADFVFRLNQVTNLEEMDAFTEELLEELFFIIYQEILALAIYELVEEGLLTEDDYHYFMDMVDEATSIEALETIMSLVEELTDGRLSAEEALWLYVDQHLLTEAEVNQFLDRIYSVRTVGEIESIMQEARSLAETRKTVTVKSTVTVKYVDEAGNALQEATSVTREEGSKETLKAPTFIGYTLTSPESVEVTFTKENQTITFAYKKNVEKVMNQKANNLPQTGDAWSLNLLLAGIVSMTAAGFYFIKK